VTAATWALISALAAGVTIGGALGWRWFKVLPVLPPFTWPDVRKLGALVGTIAGAFVLTLLTWWLLDQLVLLAKTLISELVRDRNARPEVGSVLVTVVDALAWGLKLLLAGVILVILSLGFVLGPVKWAWKGPAGTSGEVSGGDAPAAAQSVAAAASDRADEITQEVK
jgi:hypothetical protein